MFLFMSFQSVTFINFDSETDIALGMTSIQGTCSDFCGAYNYHFSDIKFVNGDQHLGKSCFIIILYL